MDIRVILGILEKKMETTIMDYIGIIGYIGWLSNLWSLFGYPRYQVPYYNRDPKRDQNFDNQPCKIKQRLERLDFTRCSNLKPSSVCFSVSGFSAGTSRFQQATSVFRRDPIVVPTP